MEIIIEIRQCKTLPEKLDALEKAILAERLTFDDLELDLDK